MKHLAQGQVRTVYKYDLPLTSAPGEVLPLRLPAGSKILSVKEQGADPLLGPRLFVWALVDPTEQLQELRYVVTVGTGHKFELTTLSERDWDYRDTVMCLGGRMVIHVWITKPTGSDVIEVSDDNV